MAKLAKVTDKNLMAAIKEEGLGIVPFVRQDEKDRTPGRIGIAKTEKGNFLVYMVNADGMLYNTSVHAEKELANGMALRRLRAAKAMAEADEAAAEESVEEEEIEETAAEASVEEEETEETAETAAETAAEVSVEEEETEETAADVAAEASVEEEETEETAETAAE